MQTTSPIRFSQNRDNDKKKKKKENHPPNLLNGRRTIVQRVKINEERFPRSSPKRGRGLNGTSSSRSSTSRGNMAGGSRSTVKFLFFQR